jgi:eukaryotic-like serine/threonine-protein kinase
MSPERAIAHYRISAKLGEGGMGEVYRATDTKLGREVAIKVLPESFAQDPDRMARFQREAQVLASLNHPNIAAIYGIEERALVMELVEGPTLAERIAAGAIVPEDALPLIQQLIDGLEYAHERGIVHRDLKPANVKLTADGRLKVLDFGLAKAIAGELAAADPTASPTLTMRATMMGAIMGTAAYMAPEQARGREVDKRADIWAFGVVLYEMLTGRQLFEGPTVTDTLASVLRQDLAFDQIPEPYRKLARLCLERDPRVRLRDIGDARLILSERAPAAVEVEVTAAKPPRAWLAAAAVLAVGLAGLAAVHFRESVPPKEVVKFSVPAPEGGAFPGMSNMALSPDGRMLVFSATVHGVNSFWLRPLDGLAARPIPGTDSANFPFWSPDSRFIGFVADGKLKKLDTLGGPPLTLCAVGGNAPTTGFWANDGWIYFPNGRDGIFRVPQAGGDPVRVSKTGEGEVFHVAPYVLQDGRRLLYWAATAQPDEDAVWVMSLDGKERKRLAASTRTFGYVPPQDDGSTAELLVMRQDTLMAQPVNAKSMEPAGDPFPVAEHVGNQRSYAFFTASLNGTLAYRTGGGVGNRQLTWFDRTGKALSKMGAPGDYVALALSPEGARAALLQNQSNASNYDLWMYDIARDVPSRFTFQNAEENDPVWSADGRMLAFSSRRDGPYTIYVKNANGASPEERLQPAKEMERPCSWSADGRFLMYVTRQSRGGIASLWTLENPLDPAKRKAAPYLQDGNVTTQGQFSPGPGAGPRWVAYTSNESKLGFEIFVQSFPAGAGKFQISRGGGSQPRWRQDGKELFYASSDGKIMGVDVKTSPTFSAGVPHVLVDTHGAVTNPQYTYRYDVTADGQRFLVNGSAVEDMKAPEPILVVLNWLAGVRK